MSSPDEDAASEQGKEKIHWWEVVRQAREAGRLIGFKEKGRARQNASRTVSFDWSFTPSTEAVATRSPFFDWLGISWNIRFQRSPFDAGILQLPAWSIFLDLNPPFKNAFRVTGTMTLKEDTGQIQLWKLDNEFKPAWEGQDVCTWCRKRLALAKYVQGMVERQKDLCISVKLSTIGLGQACTLVSARNPIETLPFPLKVGTSTMARRFAWDMKKHFSNMSPEQLDFWRSLKNKKNGHNKIKFSPRDLVAALEQDHIKSICKWKGCLELKIFVVNAIHDAVNGFAVMPYHLVFLDFDLMDGSCDEGNSEEEPWFIERCSAQKYGIIIPLLDWIVEKPLLAAFAKLTGGEESSFVSMQKIDRRKKLEQQRETEVTCDNCAKVGSYVSMPICSRCESRQYCSKECQVSHWKESHKRECKALAQRSAEEKQRRKVEEAKKEESLASDLQFSRYDDFNVNVA